jgi:putative transposase
MARLPRLDAPGIPQHVIVRGVNRQPCFFADRDYAAYLNDLRLAATQCDCAVHAYVLMTNHVHLLTTGHAPGSVSRMMQSVGRRYVRRLNTTCGRTGTLFEGRFRASLVQSEDYLLTCMRYIDRNPVRAAMVKRPASYRWSSFRANAALVQDVLVTAHAEYLALGETPAQRAAAYSNLVAEDLDAGVVDAIRLHVNKDCVLGNDRFQQEIARMCGRRTSVAGLGRPRGAGTGRCVVGVAGVSTAEM